MHSALTSHWHDHLWVVLRYLTFGTSALLVLALIGLFGSHKVAESQAAVVVAINLITYAALLIRGASLRR